MIAQQSRSCNHCLSRSVAACVRVQVAHNILHTQTHTVDWRGLMRGEDLLPRELHFQFHVSKLTLAWGANHMAITTN